MKIVKAVNLKKYFVTENYEVHAVDGVTLEIEEGEFTVTDWVAFFTGWIRKFPTPLVLTNRNVVLSKKDVHFKDTITLLISRVKAIDGI